MLTNPEIEPRRVYEAALACQDAVNLRAIARLLVAAADMAAETGGTRASYDDPAVILIVNKIESLVRSNGDMRFAIAYDLCRDLARPPRPPTMVDELGEVRLNV